MALKDKLKRLERLADEHITTLVCPECGEMVRDVGDLALLVLAASWARGAGQEERDYGPAVAAILEHPHAGLMEGIGMSSPALPVYKEGGRGWD